MRGLRVLGVSVVVVVALMAGGCGTDPSDQPATLPPLPSTTAPGTSSTAAAPTPSPTDASTPVPYPKVPADLTPVQRDAVQWVVKQNANLNRAINTGDTRSLVASMAENCNCRKAAMTIADAWVTGSAKAPNFSTITAVTRAIASKDGERVVLYTKTSFKTATYFDALGRVLNVEGPKPNRPTEYWLQKVKGDWQLARVQYEE